MYDETELQKLVADHLGRILHNSIVERFPDSSTCDIEVTPPGGEDTYLIQITVVD